ncbi:CBS domain-containing protein [Halorubrum sp. RMP-47]
MSVANTPVENLMSTDLLTVTPDTGMETAANILLQEDVGSLIVLTDEDKIAGVLTSTDFVEGVTADHPLHTAAVSEYMTTEVLTVSAAATLHDAAVTMMRDDIQHLPVENSDGEIIGMLSATDLTAQLTYMQSSGTD